MEPATTAALISGGANILSGLFGRKKKSKTLVDLRRDAEKAGFNPLTALNATGGAGYTDQGPVLSTREVLAQGVGDLAETWFNQDQVARDEQVERIKLETMQAELENINARTKAVQAQTVFGSTIPTYEASSVAAPATAAPLEGKPSTATDPRDTGEGSWLNPRLADAESAEARYGDIMQEVKGGANLINDTVYDMRLRSIERKHGKEVAEKIHDRYRAETGKSLTSIIKEETEKFQAPLSSKASPGWMEKKYGKGHW